MVTKALLLLFGLSVLISSAQAADNLPEGIHSDMSDARVDQRMFANRPLLADFTAGPCEATPRSLVQVKGNLYRHTAGGGLTVHSGLVLVTKEGALVVDPAMTCTATGLRDEIKRRFNVPVKYVVFTH